jgi:hypothetical protein
MSTETVTAAGVEEENPRSVSESSEASFSSRVRGRRRGRSLSWHPAEHDHSPILDAAAEFLHALEMRDRKAIASAVHPRTQQLRLKKLYRNCASAKQVESLAVAMGTLKVIHSVYPSRDSARGWFRVDFEIVGGAWRRVMCCLDDEQITHAWRVISV